uniref:Baculoviral IAP repeat-containing protein 3-like n=1 Tax=Phallusia mammillata TaxID=59560 RepID=A0A6F9D856_9ASCI|nr:baculoviral IAP repeat-containing protein 3-like [Phallusia mammillata]
MVPHDGPTSDEFSTINFSESTPSTPECSNQVFARPPHNIAASVGQDRSYVEMLNNQHRRDSFPHGFADAPVGDAMAMSGLYFLGHGDITKCYSCGKVQNNWREGKIVTDPTLHEDNCQHYYSRRWPATPFGSATPTQPYAEEFKEAHVCQLPSVKKFFEGILSTGKSLLQNFTNPGSCSQASPHVQSNLNTHFKPNSNTSNNVPGCSGHTGNGASSDEEFVLSDSEDIYGPGPDME